MSTEPTLFSKFHHVNIDVKLGGPIVTPLRDSGRANLALRLKDKGQIHPTEVTQGVRLPEL